jgi:hypothetical protein
MTEVLIPLKKALSGYREACNWSLVWPGTHHASYATQLRHIHEEQLSLDYGVQLAVQKVRGRWYTTEADLRGAITASNDYIDSLVKNTRRYEQEHYLSDGLLRTTWGSVTNHGRWHTAYHDHAAAYAQVKYRSYEGAAICNTCWGDVDITRGEYVPCGCHSCEDWNAGHEGSWPVLSRSCPKCGWAEQYEKASA